MLDPNQFDTVATNIRQEMFYGHYEGVAWQVMRELRDAGKPFDTLVIADRMAAVAGMDSGLPVWTLETFELVPHGMNAPEYAEMVRDTWQRRQAVYAAMQLAEQAANRQVEVGEAIGAAESKLQEIAECGQGAGPVSMETVMLEALDQIDKGGAERYETGLTGLDQVTGGVRSGEVTVIAARPGMGKTALALTLGQNFAEGGIGVHVVTLEMSRMDLAERMLCRTAGVGTDQLRLKNVMTDRQRQDVCQASAMLAKLPMMIDERSVTMQQIAAAARMVCRRNKVKVLIVDYLQLIHPEDKRQPREQQVAECSRRFKSLAKELGVAVILLSQLNRAVESRATRKPMLSDLRECVVGSTRLVDAESGRLVRIDEVQPGMSVMGVNAELQTEPGVVADIWQTGVKPVFRVTTKSGREVVATGNHPFLTDRGWVPLEELQGSDTVAVAYKIASHAESHGDRRSLCRLLGYMAGNGTCLKHRNVGVIIPDEAAYADACKIVLDTWPGMTVTRKPGDYNDASFSFLYENGYGKPGGNPMREWLKEIGVADCRDYTKFVPDFVFETGEDGAAEFLAGYLATDGCVTKTTDGRWSVRFDTTSKRLAQDVAYLLARIGVASIIGSPTRSSKSTRDMYRVSLVGGQDTLRRFASRVHTRGARGDRLRNAVLAGANRRTRSSALSLPRSLSAHAASVCQFRNQGKTLSRERCADLIRESNDPVLRMWHDSHFMWDSIRSIEPCGEEMAYDISIPGINSFLADGVAVHNSGAIEQDADVVLLLHRPHYYDDKKPENLAILDVAKQRGGVTKEVHLEWVGRQTQFRNWVGSVPQYQDVEF